MASSKNKFTLKIILSYLVLGAISIVVGAFLYAEFKNYTAATNTDSGEKKIIETGSLINLVFETDGFSRLSLLSENDADFTEYLNKTNSLFKKIEEIKLLTNNPFQLTQLDTVKALLEEKNRNIEQLRILRLTNKKDTSLDEILREVRKLESSVGLNSVESWVQNPAKLSKRERSVLKSYTDYLNRNSTRDTARVKSTTVDSMLVASRYIVAEAKKENSRIRESLLQKENELIRNDLNLSDRLREIIGSFDSEISKSNSFEKQKRAESVKRTSSILKISGILGGIVVLLFSYFILSDFFKAEKFKKNLEESKTYAEKLVKIREQLISTVSHDLKTPLNTITGYSELFENSTLTEKQKYYLAQITSSATFISHLVDDLLDYSKLEAGKLKVEIVPFSLENIIMEAGNAAKQQYINKLVDLKISISEAVNNQIYESDPLRIRQIINNLVGNAFKFTDSGSVEIIVEEVGRNGNNVSIQISVNDTGIGISKEKQKIIFDEFTQAENDTAKKFGGSGLGLAISKKLSGLLNGNLTVESFLGEGSKFVLTLPLKSSKKMVGKISSEKKETFGGLKAVIIDDDDALRALLKEMMEQMNISVETFNSYSNFYTHQIQYDFVLTDIQMPIVDGFEILKNLKKGNVFSYVNQPVIAMTGSREHDRNFYITKGFSEMLTKPFSKNQIVSVLQHIFSNKTSFSTESDFVDKAKVDASNNGEFNLSTLKSFLDTPEALLEVLEAFNMQTEKDLKTIQDAIINNNIEQIKDICHRMLAMIRQLEGTESIKILKKMLLYSENENSEEMMKDFQELCVSIKTGQTNWDHKIKFDSINY